jgi:hypothetical protein
MPRISTCFACLGLVLSAALQSPVTYAQQSGSAKPLMLITWFGPGAIPLPDDGAWKPELLTVYDKGARPVAQFSTANGEISVSFILFENGSGKPTAEGCREDAITPLIEKYAKEISKREDGTVKTDNGVDLSTTSYKIVMSGASQQNLFGFAGNKTTCAEIHLSTVRDSPEYLQKLSAFLKAFHPDLTYKPEAIDYFRLASILFKQEPGLAAPYYKSSLDAMPATEQFKTPRRIATDQLVMALGMSGDLKNSRAVAEMAASADPDYPINYYNLACADAEQANAAQAKLHLQQAFDRRANVLQGEQMPDPTKDESILKLKKDKEFWAFVQSLATKQ